MRQIINHLTDNDLYTFSCQYYILMQYPDAEVKYAFFDRNKTKYPKGFGELLQEQVNYMKNVKITDEEVNFMKKKCYYLPDWYYNFLRGYTFNPDEVTITQDEEGYLDIKIQGKWWSTIMWEMPLLSNISELSHILNGDLDKINLEDEYRRAYDKAEMLLSNGVMVGDMGTRRRVSFEVHKEVVKAFADCNFDTLHTGGFTGTSNVYLAMLYDINVLGTMSHQIISFEECVSGAHECNFSVMNRWSSVYDGHLGCFLYDCFGDDVFFDNINTKYAKLFDGLRIDSGDNLEQFNKIINMYKDLHIDPRSKTVIFSNGLNGEEAINIHKAVDGRMKDSYGIGSWLTCGFGQTKNIPALDIKPMNIVIKLVGMRFNRNRKWLDCVKLSCDKGKTLGNPAKVKRIQEELGL